MNNIPEDLKERYEETEKEFLVLCIGGTKCGGKFPDGDWSYHVKMIGFVENEKQYSVKGCLTWCEKDGEELYGEAFEETDIYRIKGYLEKAKNPEEIYLTEIISDNEENDFLANLLTEYNKEISINSETLGKLIFNKDLEWYETENNLEWCGEDVEFSISPDGENDINEFLPLAEEFYKNRQEWDKKLRDFSASQLTELANDWAYQEFYEYYDEDEEEESDEEAESFKEITEKEFAERISISGISFYTDGNFEVFYDDDDMFWGHSILIDGNIKTGELESSYIAG